GAVPVGEQHNPKRDAAGDPVHLLQPCPQPAEPGLVRVVDLGEPVTGVGRLGHSTVRITEDLYTHVRQAVEDEAAETVLRVLPDRSARAEGALRDGLDAFWMHLARIRARNSPLFKIATGG